MFRIPKSLLFGALAVLLVVATVACGGSKGGTDSKNAAGLDTAAASPTPITVVSTSVVANSVASPVPTAPAPSPQGTVPAGADRIQLQTSTTTKTYAVYGSSTDEILGYIGAYGPMDDLGQRASGLTETVWSLSWDNNHNDRACSIVTMTIKLDIKVTVPALDQPEKLSPDLLAGWKGFAGAIATHEQRHVDVFLAGARALKETMAGSPARAHAACSRRNVNNAWTSQQAKTDGEQKQFHAQDQARIAAIRDPIKGQIDSNRAQLESQKRTVDSLDGRLKELQAQMDTLNNNLNSLKSQMSALETQYQGQAMPQLAQQQYDSLRQQYNNLVPAFNALVDNYNSTLATRNSTIDSSETLRIATNALVDKYNWTR